MHVCSASREDACLSSQAEQDKKIQTSQLFASGIFHSVFPVGIYTGYLKSQRATIQTKEGHCEWMLFTLISLLRFLGGMVMRQPAAK